MNIRKLVLLAAACVAAIMVAPIATASAEVKEGKLFKKIGEAECKIQGEASFTPGLKFKLEPGTKYSFTSKNVKAKFGETPVECTGEAKKAVPAEEFKGEWEKGKAEVTGGKGDLECGTKSTDEKPGTTEAKVELTQKGEPTKTWKFESEFEFKSTGNFGEIEVKLTNAGNKASGLANFTEPEGKAAGLNALVACLEPEGAKTLKFETASGFLVEPRKEGIKGMIGKE